MAETVKAKIVVKKGGLFPQESGSDSGGSSLDSMLGELGGATADLAGGDLAAMTEQTNELMDGFLGTSEYAGFKTGEEFEVQLNPTTYKISSTSSFDNQKMGGVAPTSKTFGQATPPKPRSLSVTLFYDMEIKNDYFKTIGAAGTEAKSLISDATSLTTFIMSAAASAQKYLSTKDLQKLYLDRLLSLTKVLKDLNTPALVSFEYGSVVFEGYVKSVSVNYEKMGAQGEILSATVSLEMEEANPYGTTSSTEDNTTPTTGAASTGSASLPDTAI